MTGSIEINLMEMSYFIRELGDSVITLTENDFVLFLMFSAHINHTDCICPLLNS